MATESAALRIVTDDRDGSCRDDELTLPVPLWVFAADLGPALAHFLAYCCGRCREAASESFETSLGRLRDDFPHRDERTLKRWIEDLRAPVDDDQVSRDTKYQRLGYLECDKRKLEGTFRLTPLRPTADGPRPTVRRAGRQKRLAAIEEVAEYASSPLFRNREEEAYSAPQGFAQNLAVDPPQSFAQNPAVALDRLLATLRQRTGEDWWANWCDVGTTFSIVGGSIVATVPHRVVGEQFKKIFRSVIWPACRDGFPGGEAFEVRLGDSLAPEDFDGERDRPQGFAQNPAVLFKVKFSSLETLSGSLKNEFKVSSLGPQGFAQNPAELAKTILARSRAIADRFQAPNHFYRWQWVQAAWAVETRRLAEQALEATIVWCLGRATPHWQYARSIKHCFRHAGLAWLDPRVAGQRSELIGRLRAAGVEWDEAWEGTTKPTKPR